MITIDDFTRLEYVNYRNNCLSKFKVNFTHSRPFLRREITVFGSKIVILVDFSFFYCYFSPNITIDDFKSSEYVNYT